MSRCRTLGEALDFLERNGTAENLTVLRCPEGHALGLTNPLANIVLLCEKCHAFVQYMDTEVHELRTTAKPGVKRITDGLKRREKNVRPVEAKAALPSAKKAAPTKKAIPMSQMPVPKGSPAFTALLGILQENSEGEVSPGTMDTIWELAQKTWPSATIGSLARAWGKNYNLTWERVNTVRKRLIKARFRNIVPAEMSAASAVNK